MITLKIGNFAARFYLRGDICRSIAAGVKRLTVFLFACLALISSCEERKEVVVTETRAATTRDVAPKLSATSDERFRDAKPSPVKGETPEGWLALPATQLRLLNYRFGESGMGEVWVSISSGSVLDNVNRWFNQFGAEPVDQAGLGKLRSVPIAGNPGVWVEAVGEYASGMGSAPKSGYALAGVVAMVDGRILTVKMVGPKDEVAAASPILENFSKTLKIVD